VEFGAYDTLDPNGNITINWDLQSLDVKGANTYAVLMSACELWVFTAAIFTASWNLPADAPRRKDSDFSDLPMFQVAISPFH
jgi:hypothetical protein